MTTRYFGAPVRRNEDERLLTGQALFIDDVELPGMLHAAFLRSQVAHARIRHIDVSRALQRQGVVAAYTAADLGAYWQAGPLLVPAPPISSALDQRLGQVEMSDSQKIAPYVALKLLGYKPTARRCPRRRSRPSRAASPGGCRRP